MSDLSGGMFGSVKQDIAGQWPRLAPHLDRFKIQWGEDKGDGRQLEFYPPWESHNPNYGSPTVELFNRNLKGQYLQNAIAGDALHLMGGVDPRSNQQIDPTFYGLKQEFVRSITPQQRTIDQRAYERQKPMYTNPPSFDDWMESNRSDAYIRGYLTPDAADDWRQSGTYNDEQMAILERMRAYLGSR